jgi:hypothetical protein
MSVVVAEIPGTFAGIASAACASDSAAGTIADGAE